MAEQDPTKLKLRPGDTKVFQDDLTDTVTGTPIDGADLTAAGWEFLAQIRSGYAKTAPLVAEFAIEATGQAQLRRTLFEVESLKLDDVPFPDEEGAPRRVFWDAQVRLVDGLGPGQPYVLTYLSGYIDVIGQVSRAD